MGNPIEALHPDLRKIADKVTIPTLPEVVLKINSMVGDPKVGLVEIGRVVAEDPPILSRVLSIANSAYYGLQEPVVSAEQAATVIGARAMQTIAMQASVMNQYEHLSSVDDFDIAGVWKHSVLTAQISQMMARYYKAVPDITPEDFYTCGLLHDIGKVVLLDSIGEQYVEVFRDAKKNERPVHFSEKELLGYTHTDVGGLVAVRWDFPEHIVKTIRYHHGPRHEIENAPCVALIAVADQVAYRMAAGATPASCEKLAALAHVTLEIDKKDFLKVLEFTNEILPQITL